MRKVVALLITGIMLLTSFTAFADDDLEARVAALEEKVAALEAQLSGSVPEGVSEAPEQEEIAPAAVDTGIEWEGCSLEYKDFEITTDYEDEECVILYFDYYNGSGETKNYNGSFSVKVFQHGKEAEITGVTDNQPYSDRYTDLRSGADSLPVASCFKITDHSDIIVSLKGFAASGVDPVEFTLALE